MATALQCPACGFKHRLDAVGDAQVFPCSRCARQLKLPASFLSSTAARPGAASGSGRSGSSVDAPRRSGTERGRAKRAPIATAGAARLPLRILAWVVAFVFGALVVRVLASWTGFVDSNTFLDLMLDHSFATYWRLLVLIPVWAFFATLFGTLFIESPDWWARRSVPAAPKSMIRQRVPAAPSAASTPETAGGRSARAVATKAPKAAPTTVPRRVPSRPQPATERRAAGATPRRSPAERQDTRAQETRTQETRSAELQRPRRIPRRDTGS